jgi:hypothetical protein
VLFRSRHFLIRFLRIKSNGICNGAISIEIITQKTFFLYNLQMKN